MAVVCVCSWAMDYTWNGDASGGVTAAGGIPDMGHPNGAGDTSSFVVGAESSVIALTGASATVEHAATMTSSEAGLARLVVEDLARPVRPGGVDGRPFWNANAVWFMYPPAFDFPEVKGATVYRFRVFDCNGKVHDFETKTPRASLAPVWDRLPTGKVDVWCEGYCDPDRPAHTLGRSFRSFYKMAPFRPGSYPRPTRRYGEAVRLGYSYLLDLPALKVLAETGRPDPNYGLNCYPTKIHSSVACAMVRYAERNPGRRGEALRLARAAGDYLLANAQPENAPLAGFTPTYEGMNFRARENAGLCVLDYPCSAGLAFLALYRATGDANYLRGAERIAETYLRLQDEDGTWYLKLRVADGAPVNANRLHPLTAVDFMDAMFEQTGRHEYRRSADRAFGYVERGPLTDWNWESQYEDTVLTENYINLTMHPACSSVIRLVTRWPHDAQRLALAREVLRYAEDQFVCWRVPFAETEVSLLDHGKWEHWLVEPGAVEQYYYRQIIDASLAKFVRAYLALYKATGNPLDLAKAEALGGALVRAQQPSGRIPTVLTKEALDKPELDWVNCMIYSLETLEELSKTVGEQDNTEGS